MPLSKIFLQNYFIPNSTDKFSHTSIGPVRHIRISLCYFCFQWKSTCCLVVWLLFSGHGPYTWPSTRVYVHVYTVMYLCTRPANGHGHGRCTGRVHVRVHGRVHRPCTRVHGWYTKPIEFATFSNVTNCCDDIRKQSKAPYCLSPEVD